MFWFKLKPKYTVFNLALFLRHLLANHNIKFYPQLLSYISFDLEKNL